MGRSSCVAVKRTSAQKAVLAQNSKFVEASETKKITDSIVNQTNGLTEITVATDSVIAKTPVGQVVVIEGGRDSRYPLGLSGRITQSDLVDGQQVVTLAPVTLAEAFEKIDIDSKIQINDKTILRTFTPRMRDTATQPVAQFAKTAAKSEKKGEFVLFDPKYPNKGSLAGTAEAVQVKSIGAGLELNIERPFYDFDGDPKTTDKQLSIKVSFKMENTNQVNQIYFDKTDLFQPLKSLDFQSSAKISGGVKITGKVEGDLNALAGEYSKVWEEFEKIATDEMGTLSVTGLSKDDKKGTIPLACWAAGGAAFAVVDPKQFQQSLAIGGAFVCVSLKMTMAASGQIEAGLELSNQQLKYGITGKTDKNGVINASFINELKPDTQALQNKQAEIKLPYIKFDGQLNHEVGFDASADAIIAGIRPLSIGAMVGYSIGAKVRGEMGFKGENLTGLSKYADACISDFAIGVGLKARALAALGLQAKISVLGYANEVSASTAASWYFPKPDNISQGWQGAWYNTFDRTSVCSGKAQIEIPFLAALQTPSTPAGYPVQFTWPEVKAEDFGIGSNEVFLTDKKSWKMIIDGQEHPFEPNKDKPLFTHVFKNIGKHTATLEITGQLGGKAIKTVDVMVKGAAVTATPEKTTVGGMVKLVIAQATDVILNVGQKLATVFWSVIDNLGKTVTTATTAIGDAFEYAFNLRGEYTVTAQLKDATGQNVGAALAQKVSIEACVQNCPAMMVLRTSPTTMAVGQPITLTVVAENAPSTAIFALEGAVCSAPILGLSSDGFTTITEVCTPSVVGSTKLTIKPKAGATTGVVTQTINVVAAKKVEGVFVVPASSAGVEFIPPVDNEPVVGTLGQVLEYGASRRNMICSFKATGTTKTYRSYDPVDANGYAVLPLHNGFRNMALIANDTLIGVENPSVAVQAGEILSFKLNDNEPADNEGALTVAYSCEEAPDSSSVIFVDEFNTTAFNINKWTTTTVSPPCCGPGQPATWSEGNGGLAINLNGVSRGFMGVGDGTVFTPKMPAITGDFSTEISVKELSRQRNGYKDNSGIGLVFGKTAIGLYGNHSGYFYDKNYNEYEGHRIQAGFADGSHVGQKCLLTNHLSLTQMYSATLRLRRVGNQGYVGYKLASDANWTEQVCPIEGAEVPTFYVSSGDGGNTDQNGSVSILVDRFEVRAGVASQPTWTTNPANGHKYAAVDCGTWTQCEAQAVALGGHLVSVNDTAENAWLVSTFTPDKNYWIGLTDKDQEGVWKWTSGEAFGYSNWRINQPDNFSSYSGGAGVGEDFAQMNYHFPSQVTTADGKWNDVSVNTAYVTLGLIEKP